MPEYGSLLRLTQEQTFALDLFATQRSLKVGAFAGAGKTTTLCALAQSRPHGSGLYLVFNKSVATEAAQKFPDNTQCRTSHSVAHEAIRRQYDYSHEKLSGALNARQLAKLCDFEDASFGPRLRLSGVQQAHLILSVVKAFCQSSDATFGFQHIPRYSWLSGHTNTEKSELAAWVLKAAAVLWRKMIKIRSDLPLGHDGYMKLWSLAEPQLKYDYILLDEAQDTNAALLNVLKLQQTQVVYVGDRHQQIYAWRGAHNAMQTVQKCEEAYLTQSFRFGDEIADKASSVLASLGETRQLIGNPNVVSRIFNEDVFSRTVLARTNSSVMQEVIASLEARRIPYVVGGTVELTRLLWDVANLRQGQRALTPELFGFSNWREVIAFSKRKEGADLRALVQLVGRYGEVALRQALEKTTKDQSTADIVISTAHKAKGLEWDTVRINSDFFSLQTTKGDRSEVEAEVRLFYVAMTRAKRRLCVNEALLEGFASGAFLRMVSGDRREGNLGEPLAQRPCGAPLTPAPASIAVNGSDRDKNNERRFSSGPLPQSDSSPAKSRIEGNIANRKDSTLVAEIRQTGIKQAVDSGAPTRAKIGAGRLGVAGGRSYSSNLLLWIRQALRLLGS